MFAKSNQQIVRDILEQIELELNVIAENMPEATESVRTAKLRSALSSIVTNL